ncbi:MAG: hypothetical protein AAFS13_09775 [Pseudomonadota bacterium]
MSTTNKPITTLRDGSIKAAIWRNEGEKGPWYSVTITRIYTDDASGKVQETNSFSNGELLKVAHLATRAYDAVARLKDQDKAAAQ